MKRRGPLVLSAAGLVTTLVSGVVAFSWYSVHEIPSGAMSPTLKRGDQVIVNVNIQKIQRGDIAVFRNAPWPGANPNQTFIKRVVGVGGDTVSCCASKGLLLVNGLAVVEPYAQRADGDFQSIEFSAEVPLRSAFVLGDNRANSVDSRFAVDQLNHGAVQVADIEGIAVGTLGVKDVASSAFVDAGLASEGRSVLADWGPILGLIVGVVTTVAALVWLVAGALFAWRSARRTEA